MEKLNVSKSLEDTMGENVLNLKDVKDKLISKIPLIIGNTDFNAIEKVFKDNSFTYGFESTIPDKQYLIEMCSKMCFECVEGFVKNCSIDNDSYFIETGRFKISIFLDNDEDNDTKFINFSLEFIPFNQTEYIDLLEGEF